MVSKTKLLAWLRENGKTISWLARQLGFTYQNVWGKVHGRSPMTEGFVIRCFQRLPDLPPDIFAVEGYERDGDYLVKRIPLDGDQ